MTCTVYTSPLIKEGAVDRRRVTTGGKGGAGGEWWNGRVEREGNGGTGGEG